MFRRLVDSYHRWDIERRVDRLGWTGVYVGDYRTVPTWAYTIGFQLSLGAPEIVVFDLPRPAAENLFCEIYDQLKTGKLAVREGEPWGESRCVWRRVHPSRFEDDEHHWLGLAQMYDTVLSAARGGPLIEFEAFQLVLSDNDGHLPWEPGYDERLRAMQRELYIPASQLAPEVAV
jgi:hypothetical protein